MGTDHKEGLDNKLYTPLVREIGRIFFYMGLIFELIIFLLDRSDLHNPYQSMMFRVTFVFFVIKCICTRYNRREWIFIIITAAFSILTYRLCGKDEVVRAMVFIIAMKDLDVKRTLKVNYLLTSVGVALLGILSVLGILGHVVSSGGYGSKAEAFMVEFGLGSPNTWAIQIWLLIALYVYLYHDCMHRYSYGLFILMGIAVFALSRCRIAFLMILITACVGLLFEVSPKIRESIAVYIGGAIVLLLGMGFSIYAAITSKWWEFQTDFELLINRITTGRVQSLYAFENGGAVISNWKLFGDPGFTEYFDMGYVRLFWWYGIIPGTLALISVLVLFYYQYKTKDYAGFLLVVSMAVFSVLEAHFISPFIARAYYLFLIGGVWYRMISRKPVLCGNLDVTDINDSRYHIAFYIGALSKGGAERVFVNLAQYFLSRGYKVTMITQYKKDDEYPLPDGADRYISDLSEAEQRGRIYNFFARIIKLHRIIRQTDADLLMTTIGKSNFMAIVCSAFLKTRVVVSVVAEPSLEYPTKSMRFLLQTLFGDADGIIMQTRQQQSFLRYGLRQRSVILPNSVNPEFAMDRYEGIRPYKICMVGRMDENKNQKMAIKAFSKITGDHPDAKLILMGDGPVRDELMGLSEELGISDKVEFTGIVSDVRYRLYDAYAFLLTSDTEGMPNTLLEAMSLGVACISTDCPCGGPAEVIEDGINGILVKPGDSDGLANALDGLLSDNELMESLGRAAHETMKDYRPKVVNSRWESYYLSIIEN